MDVGLQTALLAIAGVGSLILATVGVIFLTSGGRRRRGRRDSSPKA